MEEELLKYTVLDSQTIKDTALVINQNHCRCVIVRNQSNNVVGVVSDGDIIRAILEGISLYSPVSQIVSHSFKYLHDSDMNSAYQYFRNNPGVTLIPVVGSSFQLNDVITVHDILNYVDVKVQNSQ